MLLFIVLIILKNILYLLWFYLITLSYHLKLNIMRIKVRNDYGTLQVSFEGFICNVLDYASCNVFSVVETMLNNRSGLYDLDYFEIDTNNHSCSVYSSTTPEKWENPIFPVMIVDVRKVLLENSMLLRLYNIFTDARHKLLYHDV